MLEAEPHEKLIELNAKAEAYRSVLRRSREN